MILGKEVRFRVPINDFNLDKFNLPCICRGRINGAVVDGRVPIWLEREATNVYVPFKNICWFGKHRLRTND